MKRCKRCNKPLNDSATICPTCGAACSKDPAQAAPGKASAPAVHPSNMSLKHPESTAKEASAIAHRKGKAAKKRRNTTILLLVVAIVLVLAIVLVIVRRCAKATGAISSAASFSDTQAGNAAPDGSTARVETPELTGLSLAEASAKLVEVGLVADIFEAGYDPAFDDSIVTAQSVAAGEWCTKGDHVTLNVNTLPLTLSVLQTSVRSGRITLGNLPDICRTMDTNNPNFDYSIVIHAVEDYECKGGFRCLVGSSEETPISRVSTQLLRDGKLVNGFESAVAYRDAIVWTFALEDWMGFHFDNVTGYDVYVSNRVDTASAVSKSFPPEATRSMALIDCPVANGRVRVDIPTDDALAVRITDSALPTGYTNSPNQTGNLVPKWEVKLVVSSYQWISVSVDGSGGEPQSAMPITGMQFMQKGTQATTFDGVSYTAEGDVMVLSVPIPANMGFDPYAISYIELDFGDGAYTEKIKVQ